MDVLDLAEALLDVIGPPGADRDEAGHKAADRRFGESKECGVEFLAHMVEIRPAETGGVPRGEAARSQRAAIRTVADQTRSTDWTVTRV